MISAGQRNYIDHEEAYLLHPDEISKVAGFKVPFYTYRELLDHDDLDQAMGRNKAMVILYEFKDNTGHYTCVFKKPDGTYEYFDSYGVKPDGEIDKFGLSPKLKAHLEYQKPYHVGELLKGKRFTWNRKHLQKDGDGISDCGRQVALRLRNRNMPLAEYQKMLLGHPELDSDEVVTSMTIPYLGK